MTPPESRSTVFLTAWFNFWFFPVSVAQLALMRIGTGLILLYALFVTSFDLEAHLGIEGWADDAAIRAIDPLAWPFSVLHWFQNPFWLWAVHVLAIIVAVAFLIGILPFWTGLLSLVFMLSYVHRNPAIMIGLDSLMWMALFYLMLTPCGRVFGVMASPPPPTPAYVPAPGRKTAGPYWEGYPIRVMQVHVCILYFLTGLAKLNPDWLAGTMFWHPRLVESGLPVAQEWLRGHAPLSSFVIYGAVIFLLFFPVLVWMKRFRYLALATAVFAHLVLGVFWGHFPVHFLMIILLLAFAEPMHVDSVVRELIRRFGPFIATIAGKPQRM